MWLMRILLVSRCVVINRSTHKEKFGSDDVAGGRSGFILWAPWMIEVNLVSIPVITVRSVTNVPWFRLHVLLDECPRLFTGKQHCPRLNSSLSTPPCSPLVLQNDIYVFLVLAHTLIVTSSLSSSLSWTNFVPPLLLPSLSVTTLPLLLISASSHCSLSFHFSPSATESIFSPCCSVLAPCRVHFSPIYMFSRVPRVCSLLGIGSMLMFSLTTAAFRAIRY